MNIPNNFSVFTRKHRNISSDTKVLYMFLYVNSSLTSGIYEIGDTTNTGLSNQQIDNCIIELDKLGLIIFDNTNNVIALPEMMKNNYPKGIKQIKGYINHLKKVESFNFWNTVLKVMIALNYPQQIIDYVEGLEYTEDNYIDVIKTNNHKGLSKSITTFKNAEYYLEYLNIWNNFLETTGNHYELQSLTPIKFQTKIGTIRKYEEKGLNHEMYKQALADSINNAYLFGDNKDNWKMTMSFLMRVDKISNMYEGVYKGKAQLKSEKSFDEKTFNPNGETLWDYADSNGVVDLENLKIGE